MKKKTKKEKIKIKKPEEIPAIENTAIPPASDDSANGDSISTMEIESPKLPIAEIAAMSQCVYCTSRNVVKRGKRKNKLEEVQLYICQDCGKTFTGKKIKGKKYPTEKKVIEMALDIPSQIARSHSQRYEDRPGALQRMEGVLQRCDWMIVHLEQIRDVFTGDDGEKAALTEIIRRYGTVRVKIRNLHKAWKRWGEENPSACLSARQGFSKNYSR